MGHGLSFAFLFNIRYVPDSNLGTAILTEVQGVLSQSLQNIISPLKQAAVYHSVKCILSYVPFAKDGCAFL
jgi:hypothetical protein